MRCRQPDFPAATLADAAADLHPQDFDYNAGYTGLADPKLTEALFAAMARNPRFSSIHVGAVDERFSREHQTQFAAMTLLLPDGTLWCRSAARTPRSSAGRRTSTWPSSIRCPPSSLRPTT